MYMFEADVALYPTYLQIRRNLSLILVYNFIYQALSFNRPEIA